MTPVTFWRASDIDNAAWDWTSARVTTSIDCGTSSGSAGRRVPETIIGVAYGAAPSTRTDSLTDRGRSVISIARSVEPIRISREMASNPGLKTVTT